MQRELNEFVTAVLGFPLLASLKLLTRWSGIDCGPPLPPKRPLTDRETLALREAVARTTLGAALLKSAVL